MLRLICIHDFSICEVTTFTALHVHASSVLSIEILCYDEL